MSFLDRFRKKQTKEQLQATGKKGDDAVSSAQAGTQHEKREPHAAVPGALSAHRILVRHMVTEKATMLEKHGQYLFHVSNDANKPSIMQAVQELYGVRPERVQIITMQGKRVRFGRHYGKRKDWKKAIVLLPKGKTLHAAKSAEHPS